MPRYKVAHIREQGQDMIIFPVDSSMDSKSNEEQNTIRVDMQLHARHAGLKGIVVLVWDSAGRMKFLAPQQWRSFFESINLAFVGANLNREIYW
jgi:hypothetical protein